MQHLSAALAAVGVSVSAVVGTLAIPILAALCIVAINRAAQRLLLGPERRIHLSRSGIEIAVRVAAALLWLCAGLLVLNAWGVGVSGLWTVLVSIITAVGVGFLAVWTMVSNVTASLFITIWRPFHLGETVEILPDGLRGRVSDRNLMFTVVRESEGTVLFVPNNFFFQKMFRTGTAGEPIATGAPGPEGPRG